MPMNNRAIYDGENLAILIPSFNDWDALRALLPLLDRALDDAHRRASILVIDDASTEVMPPDWADDSLTSIDSVEVLHLRCNLGHQRAIALGIYYVHEFSSAATILVMDGDGEDRPSDVPALLDEFEASFGREAIFAARTRRMESFGFQFFYRTYRVVHRALTGVEVRVGNFSVMSRVALSRIIGSPDLWNNFSAAVNRARIPRRLAPFPRGERLQGRSKMNFVSLLMHALSALSVYSDQVSARLLTTSAVFSILGLGAIVAERFVPIPGWSSDVTGWLLGLIMQALTFSILFAFLIASRRSGPAFLLQRDAPYFILSKSTVTVGARKTQ
jgi:polyisoprenyl-phosphate glycosyltransferase